MSRVAITSRERRTVFIALAIVVPSLGWVFGVKPLRATLSETQDRIVTEREALAREQAAVLEAARSPARKEFADSAMSAADARLFTGANEVAAGGTLVTYLGEVARRTHVWLASASTRTATSSAGARGGSNPASAVVRGVAGRGVAGRGVAGRGAAVAAPLPEGLLPLRVELRAESDFQGVLEFLDALERGQKVLTIERLDLARVLRAGDEDRETLSITATVVGYAISPGAAPSAATAVKAANGRGAAPNTAGRSEP